MAVEINGLTGLTFNNGSVQDVGGVGTGAQTWQNLTGSRSGSVTYTNTTGKPIMVNIAIASATTSGFTFSYVNSTIVAYTPWFHNLGSISSGVTVSFIVPNGSNYSMSLSGWNIQYWSELR
jgi:hypothetical protein